MTYMARDWDSHPGYIYPEYKSTVLRGPRQPLLPISDLPTAPTFVCTRTLDPRAADLTLSGRVNGEPLGERIIVSGCVRDEYGRALPQVLVEIWQANAAGRYLHTIDRHDAPLDPNFVGAGHVLTDEHGNYRFLTVKPGAYPWGNHHNAWRPNHIHFSLIGPALQTRLVTQMYFPGDPLLPLDPIFLATPGSARQRLVAAFDLERTEPGFALAYRFDIVLRGVNATPGER
jgi:protocatechuate 3,4-dioxygenase beta subunit